MTRWKYLHINSEDIKTFTDQPLKNQGRVNAFFNFSKARS